MNLIPATVLGVLQALPSLIALIRDLMAAVQNELGQGTGADKKEIVINTIQGIVGDQTIWQKVSGIFSWIVDVVALFKPKATPAVTPAVISNSTVVVNPAAPTSN